MYVVLTEGYDEPELIGPFGDVRDAAVWAHRELGFQSHWITDVANATDPRSTAWVGEGGSGMDSIVDYVEVIEDENGQWRARARSSNGQVIWTTEQYGDYEWALAVAEDSGKQVRVVEGK